MDLGKSLGRLAGCAAVLLLSINECYYGQSIVL